MKKLLSKRFFILAPIVLIIICLAVIIAFGKTLSIKTDILGLSGDISNYSVTLEPDDSMVKLDGIRIEGAYVIADFSYSAPGRTFVRINHGENPIFSQQIYSLRPGILVREYKIGYSRGGWVIPLAVTLYLIAALIALIIRYREQSAKDLYQYKNISLLGLAVFIAFLIIQHIILIIDFKGLYDMLDSIAASAGFFTILSFPVAFILAILMIISNIRLMLKEGRSIRNMLGIILSLLLCVGIVLPDVLSEYIYNHTTINVHEWSGVGRHIMLLVENGMSAIVGYLECILIGTIAVSLKAARRIPKFDKDYILILGSQIRKDGGLTKLLQGRADRAVEFGKMQKEKAGRDIIYVPSGGQGQDEVMSEADAIKNYLTGIGIPEDRILVENKSKNTDENISFSAQKIREMGGDPSKAAFSTTNYHVFRAGLISSVQGSHMEGIGSKTKRYFWVNAFIREFMATLYSERKRHIAILLVLLLIVIVIIGLMYIAVQ